MNIKELVTKEKGITLTETLIYITIISVVIVSIIAIATQLINIKTQADSMTIMSSEVSNVFEQVINDVREADTFSVDGDGHLLVTTGGVTNEYYNENNNLFLNNGTDTFQLTSNQTLVSEATFYDWTSTNSSNLLHIELEIQRGGLNETFQTSVHQR